jgi:hypothetical protein
VSLVYSRWDLTCTQVARTKEFVHQREVDSFGSVALRLKW